MKAIYLPIVAVCFAMLTSGCGLTEKYSRNNSAAQAWLESNDKAPANTNFEGIYYSPDWGAVSLNQRNGKVTGTVGYFHARGITSGSTAYLLLVDDEWVTKTMILKKKGAEIVEGSYSAHVPYSAKNSRPVRLARIVN
ncbi:MAG: hypothetical protein ACOYM3_04750 [Terrimicrobiaceae bacterium]